MATSITDNTQRPSQIDYKLRQVEAPRYKMMKIPLNNYAGNLPKIDNASINLEWKLPTRVYNLARSYISYAITAPVPPNAASVNVTFEDVFDLGSSVFFGSAGGTDLVNLQYANNYSKIARKLGTTMVDYLGNDEMTGLYKSNALGAGAGGNPYPVNYTGGLVNAQASYAPLDNYLENRYLKYGADILPLTSYRQFPLGSFAGTLLGVDRDFYSPQEQYLRITTLPLNKTGFSMLTLNLQVPAKDATTTLHTVGTKLTDVYLYLAVEQNASIADSMIAKYKEGKLIFRIPYTAGFKNLGSAASSQTNIQIQLSQQYGKRLKRILHTVWNPAETFNTTYDCHNWNGAKIANYQTFLDNIPLQDRIQSCLAPASGVLNSDDWLENKKFMDTNSMYLSRNHYALNWFHCDQFFEPHNNESSLPEINLDEGLEMDTAKQWLFSGVAGATAGLVHYTWAEFARDIAITPAGPIFV